LRPNDDVESRRSTGPPQSRIGCPLPLLFCCRHRTLPPRPTPSHAPSLSRSIAHALAVVAPSPSSHAAALRSSFTVALRAPRLDLAILLLQGVIFQFPILLNNSTKAGNTHLVIGSKIVHVLVYRPSRSATLNSMSSREMI
jgi:hypothetical protein